MKLLLWMVSGDIIPGGHRVQLEQTAAHLAALGVEAEVSFDAAAEVNGFDVVHGFGLPVAAIRQSRQARVPVVLSTIYWNRDYTAGLSVGKWRPQAVARRLRTGLSFTAAAVRGRHLQKCDVLAKRWQDERVRYEMADLLLPNSQAEADQIVADLGVTTPMHVVPNAVDAERFKLPEGEGERQGVLYVGRFEPHKNQLGLIEAMRGSDLPVTLMGPPHPHHADYYAACLRRAGGNIRIEAGVKHDDLPIVYQRHKVHVLPSWFETTGLVSLEGALCGCNIVTTNRGYARSYFDDLAWYCDPADPRTIRAAIQEAYETPFRENLRQRILEEYTWKHTAAATLGAYKRVLHRGTSVACV